jgi:hypothetical protein
MEGIDSTCQTPLSSGTGYQTTEYIRDNRYVIHIVAADVSSFVSIDSERINSILKRAPMRKNVGYRT